MTIRPYTAADADALWAILQPIAAQGDTLAYAPDVSRDEALAAWTNPQHPAALTFVAEDEGAVVGSYYLKPNQPGLGSHVANAGYVVAPAARGRGIGRILAEHSLAEARRRGYRAMQFNFVISTNTQAVTLWEKLGFAIVGILPRAYRHATLGYVDAYVMFRSLS